MATACSEHDQLVNVIVDLRAGRDALAITNQAVTQNMVTAPSATFFQGVSTVHLPRDLTVAGTTGDDVVVLGGVLVSGNATISGGTDADLLFIAHSTIGNNMRVSGDAGNDAITVTNSVVGIRLTLEDTHGVNQMSVSGVVAAFADVTSGIGDEVVTVANSTLSFLRLNTGAGNDQITLDRVLVSDLNADTGTGNDSFRGLEITVLGNAFVNTGEGADIVEIRSHSASNFNRVRGNLTLDTGSGNDVVTLASLSVDQSLNLRTGVGGDQASLTNVQARNANLDLGDDADRLVLSDIVVDQLFAGLGSGDDFLSVAHTRANRAVLDGGLGTRDQFDDLAGNDFGRLDIFNFERLPQPRRRL